MDLSRSGKQVCHFLILLVNVVICDKETDHFDKLVAPFDAKFNDDHYVLRPTYDQNSFSALTYVSLCHKEDDAKADDGKVFLLFNTSAWL